MKLPRFAPITLLVTLLLVAAGCAAPPGAQPAASPGAGQASGALRATPSPIVSAAPRDDVTPRPPPATGSAVPQRTGSAPPRGLLDAGAGPVEGWLGAYCWQGVCTDPLRVPPIEALPALEVSGGQLTMTLSDGTAFARWRATYSAETDDAEVLGEGGESYDPDVQASPVPLLSEVTFGTPPAGEWIVEVQVFLPDGDLAYYWRAVVP